MSRIDVGVVGVATVVFTRAQTDGLSVGNPALDADGNTVASIDANGLITYRPDLASKITLASGVEVHGVQALYPSGDPYDATLFSADDDPMLMLRSPDNGFATVVCESSAVSATQRLTNAYGSATVTLPREVVQIFWQVDGGARRWRSPHWGKLVATEPSHWSPLPDTTGEAVDQLAQRAPIVDSGLTIVTNGVPAVLWSKTVAEGTVLAGRVTIRAAVDNAGTIQDSYVIAEFTARRSVAGLPTVTVIDSSETGTFGLGAVAVDISANDVRVVVTYADSGTLTWVRTDDTKAVTP